MAGHIEWKRTVRTGGMVAGGMWIGLILTSCGMGNPFVPTPLASDADDNLQIPETILLTSPAFRPNEMLPARYTCDGENFSPALVWDAPPAAARSFVLLVEDPDAPGKTPRNPFVHWVVYDLPSTLRQLPEKLPAQPFLAIGGIQGRNDFGQYGYGGACPPSGTHRYLFKLYALDQFLDLPPGTTRAQVVEAMKGHIVAGAELTGQYERK
jgi:Raf kinase inhibitor-like YbhB/YbcL family protein